MTIVLIRTMYYKHKAKSEALVLKVKTCDMLKLKWVRDWVQKYSNISVDACPLKIVLQQSPPRCESSICGGSSGSFSSGSGPSAVAHRINIWLVWSGRTISRVQLPWTRIAIQAVTVPPVIVSTGRLDVNVINLAGALAPPFRPGARPRRVSERQPRTVPATDECADRIGGL
ncbi:hypothetical protein MSG28_013986 [Choristoneura fumiferana]|uniref:Uncharacterized protein n=1 Tax=Choristoneura fumiferana TaxID=7141 RepID=A0ACC0K9T4_CHOFU|nr:hypothetical protein MSG28_013986 [Choristoneura fumiferana]